MKEILNRRSIRKFKPGAVTDEQVHDILMAAMSAPNGFSTKEWEFIVVRSEEGYEKLERVQKWGKFARNSDVFILVCGDTHKETSEQLVALNVGAAIQNMLTEATYLGLGSLWLGVYSNDQFVADIQREFNIPSHIIPMGAIVIGHADQTLKPHDKFYADKVHKELFGQK